MRYTNDDNENDDEETTTEQTDGGQPSGQQPSGGQPPRGPEAASKRDVQEAEAKADDARDRLDHLEGRVESLQERNAELKEELEEARQLSAAHAAALEYLFENAGQPGFGKLKGEYEVPEPLEEYVEEMRDGMEG